MLALGRRSGDIAFHPVEGVGCRPRPRHDLSAADPRSSFVVYVNAGASEVAAGGTGDADLQRRATPCDDRRRHVPHRKARFVIRRHDLTRAASRPAMRPNTVTRGRPCSAKPPADSPAQKSPGIAWPRTSSTSHRALVRRPASASCRIGVAHAAWNGGFWTLNIRPGLPNSGSLPASTYELYFATASSSARGGIGAA